MENYKYKLFIGCILISLCSIKAMGQSDSAKHKNYPYIQLNIGMGIPITLPNDQYNNEFLYSSNGYSINLSVVEPIKHSIIGIEGMIGCGGNNMDISSYYAWCQSFSESNGGYYSEYSALIGPLLSLPIMHGRGAIVFRLMGGMLYFVNPDLIYSGEYFNIFNSSPVGGSGADGTWVVNTGNTSSFATDFGIGLKSTSRKGFFGGLNFDIFYSRIVAGISSTTQFTDAITGQISTSSTTDNSFKVSLLNITACIGYTIGK